MGPRATKWICIGVLIFGGPRVDYTRFSHFNEKHRAACSSCHTLPVTDYPKHQACLSCHRRQFFARERPAPRICSNCHVKATPIDTSRYPFPARRFVSEFYVAFPHDKHADSACIDCHTGQSMTHESCFICHNQESELAPLPPNCEACHKRS